MIDSYLLWFCITTPSTPATCHPIRSKIKSNQSWLAGTRFLALCVGHLNLPRVLIGSLDRLCPLWLARVILLVKLTLNWKPLYTGDFFVNGFVVSQDHASLIRCSFIFYFFFFSQSKSEERSQALAMLMLQYCAGYQSCVEAEELDSYQLWAVTLCCHSDEKMIWRSLGWLCASGKFRTTVEGYRGMPEMTSAIRVYVAIGLCKNGFSCRKWFLF